MSYHDTNGVQIPHPATREDLARAIVRVQARARTNLGDAATLADEAIGAWERAVRVAAALDMAARHLEPRGSWWPAGVREGTTTIVSLTERCWTVTRGSPSSCESPGVVRFTLRTRVRPW